MCEKVSTNAVPTYARCFVWLTHAKLSNISQYPAMPWQVLLGPDFRSCHSKQPLPALNLPTSGPIQPYSAQSLPFAGAGDFSNFSTPASDGNW